MENLGFDPAKSWAKGFREALALSSEWPGMRRMDLNQSVRGPEAEDRDRIPAGDGAGDPAVGRADSQSGSGEPPADL